MNAKTSARKKLNPDSIFHYRYPPFSDTREIDDPFLPEQDQIILGRMESLIRQGKSFALYGEPGTGKSMLLKALIQQLDTKAYRVANIPYGGTKRSALLKEICEALDIDCSGRTNLLSKLRKSFRPQADKPFPLIVVDEAHEMERQSFMDLVSLLHDPHQKTSAASLILSGHGSLKKMLGLDIFSAVRTRLAFLFPMPKLDADSAKEFILYRLRIAEAAENIFEPDALQCLALDCAGNRRILMNLAAMALQAAAERNEKVVTADLVNTITAECRA